MPLHCLAFGMPGTYEWLIILLILLILFGATKLPQIGSAIGQSIRNYKRGMREAQEEEARAERKKLEDDGNSPNGPKDA